MIIVTTEIVTGWRTKNKI